MSQRGVNAQDCERETDGTCNVSEYVIVDLFVCNCSRAAVKQVRAKLATVQTRNGAG